MLIQDQFGIIQNLQTSPIAQISFLPLDFFAVSYSKRALKLYLKFFLAVSLILHCFLFQANQAKKTLYVKSQQLPRLNGKPVFLAINPHSGPAGPGRPPKASHDDPDWSASPSQKRAAGPPPTGDQVAILVRPQQAASNSKPVLLNVPRKVALKVKVGTTLSFSASNDHKYVVMDSKIHPPVGTGQRAPNRGPGRPSGPGPNKNRLPSSLSVIRNSAGSGRPQNSLSNLMNNKRPGLTITRGPQGYPGSYIPAKKARKSLPSGSNILASGEV